MRLRKKKAHDPSPNEYGSYLATKPTNERDDVEEEREEKGAGVEYKLEPGGYTEMFGNCINRRAEREMKVKNEKPA